MANITSRPGPELAKKTCVDWLGRDMILSVLKLVQENMIGLFEQDLFVHIINVLKVKVFVLTTFLPCGRILFRLK